MAETEKQVPTFEEFVEASRNALAFLSDYGFKERAIPKSRDSEKFQVWFQAEDRFVVVKGEGWGEMATIDLEHSSGVHISEIYLVPVNARPKYQGSRKRKRSSQLEQIREAAERIRLYGMDFVGGQLERYFQLAKPLPPYLDRVEK